MLSRSKKAPVVAEPSISRTKMSKTTSVTKKSKPESKPAPVPVDEFDAESAIHEDASESVHDNEEGSTSEDEEGSDSSDSDAELEGFEGFDVDSLPTVAKDDATVKRKLERAKRQPTVDRGVIYLSRIPHGFYEQQIKAYFSQFGEVTRLRLSRNKKTGRSKRYGYIEFDSSSVAQIVADTMDNYLLMGHILKCKVIPKDDVHPELWVGANRKWRVVPRDRITREAHNKPRTEDEQRAAESRLVKRQAVRKRKLEEAGIKYDFDAVAYKKKPNTV